MNDKYPNYILKLTLGRLEKVREEISMYNKYLLPDSEVREILSDLDAAIAIFQFNIADNEAKNK